MTADRRLERRCHLAQGGRRRRRGNVNPAGVRSLGSGERAFAGDGEVDVGANELRVVGEEHEVPVVLVEASQDLGVLKLHDAVIGTGRLRRDLRGDESLAAQLKWNVGDDVGVDRECSGLAGACGLIRDLGHLNGCDPLVEGAHHNSNRLFHKFSIKSNYNFKRGSGGYSS